MKLSKILKQLNKEACAELDGMDKGRLEGSIAGSEEAIDKATRERDALPAYQGAKQAVKDLSEGLKELKNYQKAKIAYALRRLRELNGEDVGDDE